MSRGETAVTETKKALSIPMRGYEGDCNTHTIPPLTLSIPMRGYETKYHGYKQVSSVLSIPMRGYEIIFVPARSRKDYVIYPHEGL